MDVSLRVRLFRTFPGQALLVSAIAKLLLVVVGAGVGRPTILQLFDVAATLGLILSLGYFLARALGVVRHRFLWRLRRKLILSYVFIGVIPVCLVVAFFALAGVMLFLNVSAYLAKNGFDELTSQVSALAERAVGEIRRGVGVSQAGTVLERNLAGASDRYPGLSLALAVAPAGSPRLTAAQSIAVGPWNHLPAPVAVPTWVGDDGFRGLLVYQSDEDSEAQLVVRAVSLSKRPSQAAYAVIVDVPVRGLVLERLRESTGIRMGAVSVVETGQGIRDPAQAPPQPQPLVVVETPDDDAQWGLGWVTFLEFTDWPTGRTGRANLFIQARLGDIYDRLAGAQAQLGTMNLGYVVLLVLGTIGSMFLIIEAVALATGLVLARSITGSVHELFEGTQRVGQGTFSHRIRVKTRDQLGGLADSFNKMTASIEELLQQAKEKRCLEEELRIARRIQMSLLPDSPAHLGGISIAAFCEPARQVGGDYYDFFPLHDDQLGILIADVSGKGTSAALYMAELKGLMLSLSTRHDSPKRLLVEANRILSNQLDSASFITMLYAILDGRRNSLVYARAGHTPLVYLPGHGPGWRPGSRPGRVRGRPGTRRFRSQVREHARRSAAFGVARRSLGVLHRRYH